MNVGVSFLGVIVFLLAFGLATYSYSTVIPEFNPIFDIIEYWEYTVYPFTGLAALFGIYGFFTLMVGLFAKETRVSAWWYVPPIYFSIIGGLITYVALKEKDEDLATLCLGAGILSMVLVIFVGIAYALSPPL